ncbi:AAA family ATPase [Actinoplanes sp. NBRC 101535]|uniref:AAA family ATPase n=1 Tax=Actinoplanes sp. NBRC 101535 TaxID=3032196 RepID=UPI0024A23F87|nr:AAA family ATPase [Actinoplanes sp. NBRC 101535]GLY07649.1 hypothetical protein Acsp01_80280 [Actinoplanes sp. NBRC 101535]
MSADRRWFIGAATARYTEASGLAERPGLVDEVARFAGLFGELGYVTVPGFGHDHTVSGFSMNLRRFLIDPQRTADDVVVLYYTGHALVENGELLLPMADTDGDLSFTSMRAGDLTTRFLAGGVRVRQMLLILDTCHAAIGGASAARGAIDVVNRLNRLDENPSIAVVVAARPAERAVESAFGTAFVAAVHDPASGGVNSDFLPLDGLVDLTNRNTPPWQHARHFLAGDRITPFVPNPRSDPWLRDLDVRTGEGLRQKDARRAERLAHVLPAARGLRPTDDVDAWLFTGREHALRDLVRWLSTGSPATMVVTGDPGSGKSAVLARLFVLADRRLRGQVPQVHRLAADTMPAAGAIREFVHARGKTARGLLAALADACAVERVASPGELLQAIRGREPIVVVVDGVDEAITEAADENAERSPRSIWCWRRWPGPRTGRRCGC